MVNNKQGHLLECATGCDTVFTWETCCSTHTDTHSHTHRHTQRWAAALTWSRAPVGESCGVCGGLVQGSEQSLKEEGEPGGGEVSGGLRVEMMELLLVVLVVVVVGLWLHSHSVARHHPRCRGGKPVGLRLERQRNKMRIKYCRFFIILEIHSIMIHMPKHNQMLSWRPTGSGSPTPSPAGQQPGTLGVSSYENVILQLPLVHMFMSIKP